MSRKSKGNQYEKWARKVLEADGWVVHRAESQGTKIGNFYVSRSNDIFHCIDLVAKKKGYRTRWIQVTSENVGIGVKAKKMEQVPWTPEHDCVEVWQYHGGRVTKTSPNAQYFQVRLLDQDYALMDSNRIFLSASFRKGE